MFCTQCGKEIASDARFCVWCGAPVAVDTSGAGAIQPEGAAAADDATAAAGAAAAAGMPIAVDAGQSVDAPATVDAAQVEGAAPTADAARPAARPVAQPTDNTMLIENVGPDQSVSMIDAVAPVRTTAAAGKKISPAAIVAPIAALLVVIVAIVVIMTQMGARNTQSGDAAKPSEAQASQSAESAPSPGSSASSNATADAEADAESGSAASGKTSVQSGSASSASEAASSGASSKAAAEKESAEAKAQKEAEAREAAEAEARESAEAAGKQVFTGVVRIEDAVARMDEVGAPNAMDTRYGNPTFAFMILDEPATVTAKNADGGTVAEEPYRTHDGIENVLLGQDRYDAYEVEKWEPYEGQRVMVAASPDEMSYFSDTMGVLFNVSADAELVFSDYEGGANGESAESGSGSDSNGAASASGDYVLPESASRLYSTSELEALDNYTLFLARNEIYARHGRMFKSEELQQHFGSKSWYHPTIDPDSFDDSVLSDVESKNAAAMLRIEQRRGSQYV